MEEFVINYGFQTAFGIIVSFISVWCKRLSVSLKERRAEQEALKTAMIAILHDRLFHICNVYLLMGYIPVEKSEEILDNAKIVYEAYHTLGGNGTGTEVYSKFKGLKIKGGE